MVTTMMVDEAVEVSGAVPEAAAALVGVTKRYGAVTALDGLSLSLRAGEIVALLGPNGAGKSTAVRLMLGLTAPSTGTVRVFGHDPRTAATRARVGAMLQVGSVPKTLKVREHIDLFRSYYPAPLTFAEVVRIAQLQGIEDRLYEHLSGGQRQRLLFGLALCGNPDLVFLDEPTVGMDIEARRGLWAQIRLLAERGKTVLLTTHYLEEADALADRIIVIDKGKVVSEGTPAEVKSRGAGRTIRCVTRLAADFLWTLPSVTAVEQVRGVTVVTAMQAEAVVREMLLADESLSGLEIASPALEDAFLALTGPGTGSVSRRRSATSPTPPSRDVGHPIARSTSWFVQEVYMATAMSSLPIRRAAALPIYLKETKYEFLKLFRTRSFSLAIIAFPVMFYVLFGVMNKHVYDGNVSVAKAMLAGYACFGVIGAALFGIGVGMGSEKAMGWLELKRASPMPPMAYLFGKCMTAVAFGLVIVTILIVIGVSFAEVKIAPLEIVKMLGMTAAGAVAFASMGLLLALVVPPNAAPGVVNLIYLPMSFMSGLWIPVRFLPHTLQKIAPFLPTYHFAQLMLGIFGYRDRISLATHWAGLVGFALLMLGASWAVFHRQENAA